MHVFQTKVNKCTYLRAKEWVVQTSAMPLQQANENLYSRGKQKIPTPLMTIMHNWSQMLYAINQNCWQGSPEVHTWRMCHDMAFIYISSSGHVSLHVTLQIYRYHIDQQHICVAKLTKVVPPNMCIIRLPYRCRNHAITSCSHKS